MADFKPFRSGEYEIRPDGTVRLLPSQLDGRWRKGADGRSHYSHSLDATVSYCGIAFASEHEDRHGRCASCAEEIIKQGRFDMQPLTPDQDKMFPPKESK